MIDPAVIDALIASGATAEMIGAMEYGAEDAA